MGGKKDFAAEHFTVNHSIFKTGDFLNALFAFVLVAAVLYFLVVKPFSALLEQVKDDEAPAAATVRDCPHCVSSVPIKATVCAYCTRDLPALEVDA
jgi:large conductance mechanosensitive channel